MDLQHSSPGTPKLHDCLRLLGGTPPGSDWCTKAEQLDGAPRLPSCLESLGGVLTNSEWGAEVAQWSGVCCAFPIATHFSFPYNLCSLSKTQPGSGWGAEEYIFVFLSKASTSKTAAYWIILFIRVLEKKICRVWKQTSFSQIPNGERNLNRWIIKGIFVCDESIQYNMQMWIYETNFC